MATVENAISFNVSLNLDASGITERVDEALDTIAQNALGRYCNTQLVPTANTALLLGSIAVPGWMHVKNLEALGGNFIQIGLTGSYFIKLLPQESNLFRLSAGAPFALADTGSVELDYTLFED